MADRVDVDPDLEDLIPGFLHRRFEELRELRGLLAEGRWEAVARLGHRLKGTGEGYGFVGLTPLGQAIEQAGKAEAEAELVACIRALDAYLDQSVVKVDGAWQPLRELAAREG